MEKGRRFFSVKLKIYIFVATTVLVVALGTSLIAYLISANRIDAYYRQNTSDNARNVASMVDGDFLAELKVVAVSEEFQALRDQAEKEDDEEIIITYLQEHGLWEEYSETRTLLTEYLANMQGIEYVYIVAHGDMNAEYDMYLVDDEDNPVYETGYYEVREDELRGTDLTQLPEPTISNGDWGWLCSDFKPVYDSEGNCVCIVGCDINMDEVMAERSSFLISLGIGALIYTAVVLVGAMLFVNKTIVGPVTKMTDEMKKFKPSTDKDYETAGVMNLDIYSSDEISEIYHGIRNMQMSIVDYLRDMGKTQADLKNKEQRISKLSDETNKDALTGVGSKTAYVRKTTDITNRVVKEGGEFAVVMIDLNNLKNVNDGYGHKAGDMYILGCCHTICEVFKHSPVFRIGGDEFVVILEGHDYENRIALTEKLKSDFTTSFEQEDRDPWLRFSAAVGMAENASDDTTYELVFKRADKAMYDDKAAFKKAHAS
jgi:diguanylate cyclase (GGDEF)-like protein